MSHGECSTFEKTRDSTVPVSLGGFVSIPHDSAAIPGFIPSEFATQNQAIEEWAAYSKVWWKTGYFIPFGCRHEGQHQFQVTSPDGHDFQVTQFQGDTVSAAYIFSRLVGGERKIDTAVLLSKVGWGILSGRNDLDFCFAKSVGDGHPNCLNAIIKAVDQLHDEVYTKECVRGVVLTMG